MVANIDNWNEVGYSYPSCEKIYVRNGIVGPGGGITLTPPLVLTETNAARITTTLGTIALEGFATPFSASTRQTMRSLTVGNDASVIRWLRSDNALRFSMGNDASGNAKNNWWLFDNAALIYPLYFPSNTAGDTVGSIRWHGGRVAYDTSTEQMTRRVANVVRETFDPTQYTLNSGGTLVLTSVLGMALTGSAGLSLLSGDNATLQATNAVTVTAGTTGTLQSAGPMLLRSTGATVNIDALGSALALTAASTALLQAGSALSLLAGTTATLAAGGLISISTPTDISITGASSVTVSAGAGPVDVNGLGPVTIDGTNGTVLGGGGHSVGFYGSVGVVKQVGVPVTAAGIHAALVALNLIAP